MSEPERRFHHGHAHKLEDPERATWMPVRELVARLALRDGMVVADVGAGTGYFTLPFATAVAPTGRVIAVDVQPEMLSMLRARVEREKASTVELVEAAAERTTVADRAVDLAFYANVWHELDDAAAALAEARRMLREGGRIAILDWRTDVPPEPGPRAEHRIGRDEVVRALAANGWSIEASEPFGTFSYLVLARPA